MANKKKNVFLTGITGFLGSFLAKELIQSGYRVFGLARPKGGKSAKQRAFDAVRFAYYDDEWDEKRVLSNFKIFEGDIVHEDLGLSDEARDFLRGEIDIIIHSAALAELRSPWETIKRINVDGTKNVLDFAVECQEKGRLKKFNHISTMYVCGDYQGEFDETMLDVGQKFNNTYERSKFEAEVLVHKYMDKDLNCSIFRPSLIVGDSKTGKTNNFQNIYKVLFLFSQNRFVKYPINPNSTQNLINIDTVVHSISLLASKSEKEVYHLISLQETKWDFFVQTSSASLGFKLPECIPVEVFAFDKLTPAQKLLIKPLLPYFNCKAKFTSILTRKILKEYDFRLPEIDATNINRILSYYAESNFINKMISSD